MRSDGNEISISSDASIFFPPFRLERREQRLWRGERLVPLKPRAFAILRCLVEHPGQLITHDELRTRFWCDMHLSEGVIRTQIAELRQALEDSAREPRFIETAHRRGYRFIGHIEPPDLAVATRVFVSTTGSMAHVPRALPVGAAHLVGRESELEWLSERWTKACAGERQTVFVTGEAGVGKTVLVNAFLKLALRSQQGAIISWGHCIDQYGAGEPYLPIVEALRRVSTEAEDTRVAEGLRRFAPAWLPVLSYLKSDQAAGVELAAPALPGRMLREMAEALEVLSRQHPLILLIEDLHWADYSTLDLLAYISQRSDPARLLLLGTHRPSQTIAGRLADVMERLHSRGRSAELIVPPLKQRAVGEYLASRFVAHQLPQAVQELVHQRTEGNALFMVGLIDNWLLRGLLASIEGRCELRASLDELGRCVPENFVRMVEKELARSSPLERNVLEAASVAGNEFSAAAVAAALSMETVHVEEVCMRWARRGQFICSMGPAEWRDGTVSERFRFLHVLHQQITYAQLGAARHTQWHQRIGERLEAGYAGEADAIASVLALHFQRSRDLGRAVQYLRSAGERALDRSAYQEAIDHLTRALELLAKLPTAADLRRLELELLLLLATPLRMTKGFGAPELEETYRRATELCEHEGSPQRRFLVMVGKGALHITRAEHASALTLGTQFLQLAERAEDSRAMAHAHSVLGAAYHHMGYHDAAIPHLDRAIAFYDAEAIPAQPSATIDLGQTARGMRAVSLWTMGYADSARRYMQETLDRARATQNPFAVAYAFLYASGVYFQCHQFDESLHYAQCAGTLSADQKLDMFSSVAVLRQGIVHLARGEFSVGSELIQRGLAAYAGTGARAYVTRWAGELAWAHYRLGETSLAMRVLSEVKGDSNLQVSISGADLLRLEGEILAQAEGGPDASHQGVAPSRSVEDCFLRALELARAQCAKSLELRAAMSLAKYWLVHGQATQAYALLSGTYSWFTEGFDTGDLKAAKALLEELARDVKAPVCTGTIQADGLIPK